MEGRFPERESPFQQMPSDQRQQSTLEVQCLLQKIITQRRNPGWGGCCSTSHISSRTSSEGCRLRLQRGFGRGSGSCGREVELSLLERSSSGHGDTGAWGGVFAFQGVREHLKLGLEPGARTSIVMLGKQLLLFCLLTLHLKILLPDDVYRRCPQ